MYREALILRPVEPLTYAKLGQCQLETGQMEAADVTFESLRVLDPASTAASTGPWTHRVARARFRVAREYFLDTLSKQPGERRCGRCCRLSRKKRIRSRR
jgi:hypothetical protein